MSQPLLEAHGIVKRFGRVRALRGTDGGLDRVRGLPLRLASGLGNGDLRLEGMGVVIVGVLVFWQRVAAGAVPILAVYTTRWRRRSRERE